MMLSMETLSYPRIPSKVWRKANPDAQLGIIEYTLPHDLSVDQWIVPAGITVKIWQTQNFRWYKLPNDCKSKTGHIMPRTLFKY